MHGSERSNVGTAALTLARDFTGLRVLVVEDEPLVAMLVEDILGDLGCQVVGPVSRLEQALTVAAEAQIDCALLDVHLGSDQSYPVADLLRERGIPFCFSSGVGDGFLRPVDARVAVLQKPYRDGDVARILGAMLGNAS